MKAYLICIPLFAVAAGCSTTDDPPLRLGKTLEALKAMHGDAAIRFEYINSDDESTFSGVVVPAYAMLDERGDERGQRLHMIQCKVQDGTFLKCRQYVAGQERELSTIYGHNVKGLSLRLVSKEGFVKIRQAAISFRGYYPTVDMVSNLNRHEIKHFSGRVVFIESYESFSYDFVDGVAVKVAVSSYMPRKWP